MAENDNIASNLNNLFGSNLFKENNFIKIYNLLGITNIESQAAPPEPASPPAPAAPAPAPAAPAAASTEIDKILGKFNYNNNNNKLFYDINTINTEITIFDDNKNLGIIIKEFIKNISVTDFNVNKGAFETALLDSIIIGDIVNELGDNDIIVDPAGLNFMKGDNNLNDAAGLSYALYNYIKGTGDFYSPKKVQSHFKKFDDETKLFINKENQRNAFYNDYTIHKHDPKNDKASNIPQVIIKSYITNLKLIHAIGPNYMRESLTDIKDEYKKFMILYNDIYQAYNNIKTITDKNLRLPLHSTGIFSGNDTTKHTNINYILICLALAYLYIYCTINEGNKDEVKIYYLFNDEIIKNFKKILEKIIEKIIE